MTEGVSEILKTALALPPETRSALVESLLESLGEDRPDEVKLPFSSVKSDPSVQDRQKEDWCYYFALYHMLAHWTAYLTILVFMVTVGILRSSSESATMAHPRVAILGLIVLVAVEIYLVWCIYRENEYLIRKLPTDGRPPELMHTHGTAICIGIGFAAVAFTLWDVSLIW